MADAAAHLVDRVLPEVPTRQWVLSLPFPLRYRLAYDRTLATPLLAAFLRAVFASLKRRARERYGVRRTKCEAVTILQRFGGALNLNAHFHSLVLDGVYEVHLRVNTPRHAALSLSYALRTLHRPWRECPQSQQREPRTLSWPGRVGKKGPVAGIRPTPTPPPTAASLSAN